MSDKQDLCPICKTEFQPNPNDSFDSCVGGCGMGRWNTEPPIWYRLNVGKYRVYWDHRGSWIMDELTCRTLWVGDLLHYSVTEDVIKMLLVFQ